VGEKGVLVPLCFELILWARALVCSPMEWDQRLLCAFQHVLRACNYFLTNRWVLNDRFFFPRKP
jgi:hypothetical protein